MILIKNLYNKYLIKKTLNLIRVLNINKFKIYILKNNKIYNKFKLDKYYINYKIHIYNLYMCILEKYNFLYKNLYFNKLNLLVKENLYNKILETPNKQNNFKTFVNLKNINFSKFSTNTYNIYTPLELELNLQLKHISKTEFYYKSYTEYIKVYTNNILLGIDSIETILEIKDSTESFLVNPTISLILNSFRNIPISTNKHFITELLLKDIINYNNIIQVSCINNYEIETFYTFSNINCGGTILTTGKFSPRLSLKNIFNTLNILNTTIISTYTSFIYIFYLLLESLIKQYKFQNIILPSILFELIIKKMVTSVKIIYAGHTNISQGNIISFTIINLINYSYYKHGLLGTFYEPIVLGITKISLINSGVLSTISFQETLKSLSKISLTIQLDWLVDLKSKVITSELLETGTGWFKKFLI